ncbi:MAG: phospholipid carrier-dependent glycosyltransferase [Anaerolineae bacterium]|jgi:4-amino-4-deoxy-L-arabinose transferase-like glycosyltransferase|nr:phospholipid carrier-dependent glycosyltransferase [Candidatus Jacksonbacteria bacterium]MBT7070404.1 phospholipid carrier-dependent glycosyltransferase [Anaerolineae bacterium]MBT7601160.1 phospholipid carrier-dependent glycosyltransferase [Anaerolineae bacterium]MBT7990595.1 phospholipid carrier-dependent glycosyltransferase [Anaerolineae bacterium]
MKKTAFFQKYEKWLPLLLALFFVLLTASNLDSMRNPDELLHRVTKALEGEWQFDETNFDYPSLPKYVMYGVGQVVYALDRVEDFSSVARFLSVLLGAGTIFLAYKITRKLGGGILASSFAALFLISNHTLAVNARFAHNDLYLTFFLALTVYLLLHYQDHQKKGWLYLAFFTVGLAASSKYNGGVFLLMPLLVFAVQKGKSLFAENLAALETLFIGIILTFLGFAAGTPKALFWMSFYLKRILPALSRHASYGKAADSVRGVIGQWGVLQSALGLMLFLLVLLAFFYFAFKFFKRALKTEEKKSLWVVLLAILVFDLPIMASYNYQARFFIPLMPFFAVISALFIEELYAQLLKSKFRSYHLVLPLAAGLILFFAFLQVISVRLLLANDPRMPAAEMIASLPAETSLEYTMYPPAIPSEHFEREHSYPVFFTKFEGQEVPEVGRGKPYKAFNEGEAGLIKRGTDYIVIDSFTYARCADENIYATNPVECAFFESLLAGETSYEMVGEFTYSLPKFLPQISLAFVNPDVHIFQKGE